MPAFDVLDALVRGGNGVLRTADAVAAGITRPVLGNYVRERDLERVGHGLYLAPDAWKDGMYLLHLRCPQAVFSHDTADRPGAACLYGDCKKRIQSAPLKG